MSDSRKEQATMTKTLEIKLYERDKTLKDPVSIVDQNFCKGCNERRVMGTKCTRGSRCERTTSTGGVGSMIQGRDNLRAKWNTLINKDLLRRMTPADMKKKVEEVMRASLCMKHQTEEGHFQWLVNFQLNELRMYLEGADNVHPRIGAEAMPAVTATTAQQQHSTPSTINYGQIIQPAGSITAPVPMTQHIHVTTSPSPGSPAPEPSCRGRTSTPSSVRSRQLATPPATPGRAFQSDCVQMSGRPTPTSGSTMGWPVQGNNGSIQPPRCKSGTSIRRDFDLSALGESLGLDSASRPAATPAADTTPTMSPVMTPSSLPMPMSQMGESRPASVGELPLKGLGDGFEHAAAGPSFSHDNVNQHSKRSTRTKPSQMRNFQPSTAPASEASSENASVRTPSSSQASTTPDQIRSADGQKHLLTKTERLSLSNEMLETCNAGLRQQNAALTNENEVMAMRMKDIDRLEEKVERLRRGTWNLRRARQRSRRTTK